MNSKEKFINIVKSKCKEHNVDLQLRNSKKVKYNEFLYTSGFFEDVSDTKGVLACGIKHPQFLEILTHEFSHMEQWIEKAPINKNAIYCGDMDEWLSGKDINNIYSKLDKIKLLELDCEKRTVKNIKKYSLPINVTEYIQKANCYVLYYNFIKESRKWVQNLTSEKNKDLWSLCPKRFMKDEYYEYIPPKIYDKFVEKLGL